MKSFTARIPRHTLLLICALSVLNTKLFSQTSTVLIDKSVNYQKITGFGAFEEVGPNSDNFNPSITKIAGVTNEALVQFLIDSLGYSALHTAADNTIEIINDDSDPNHYNWENFTYLRGSVADPDGVAGGCIRLDCQSVKLPGIVARQVYALPNGAAKSCAGPNNPQMYNWLLAKAFRDHMIAKGDTPLVIARTWTSPAWMKYNNCFLGTSTYNTLIMDNIKTPELDASASWSFYHDPRTGPNSSDVFPLDRKEEFAEYITAHMILVASIMGFSWDYMTLTNEPAFKQPYLSIGFSPLQHALAFYAVSKKMEKMRRDFAHLNIWTKLAWSEDIGNPLRWRQYKLEVINNDSIRPYSYDAATTVHAYNSTGTAAGSTSTILWNDMYTISNVKGNRPFMMTETSCYGYGTYGMIRYLKSMYVGLKWGKNNAWIHWTGVLKAGDNLSPADIQGGQQAQYYEDEFIGGFLSNDEHCFGLLTWPNNQPQPIHISKRAYGQAHYGRFVRPGSYSIGCEVLKPNGTIDTLNPVLALAFQDNEKERLTVVITNTNDNSAETVRLSFTGNNLDNPTHYKVYRTSETENLLYLGTVTAATLQAGYTFPRRSVTTFYGNNSKAVHVPVKSLEIFAPNYMAPAVSIPGTIKFSHTVMPLSATNKNVTWSVSDEEVATIDQEGNFRVRRAPATVTVTARSQDNPNVTASLTFNITGRRDSNGNIVTTIEPRDVDFVVYDPETGESVTELEGIGREYGIAETITPSSATIFGKEWSWAPQGVVVVDNELVIPVGVGEVSLTGTFFSTDTLSKTIRLTVRESATKTKDAQKFDADLVVSVQPNPSEDYFIVKVTTKVAGAYEVSMTDVFGKTVYKDKMNAVVGTTYQNIDVRNMAKGVYILKVGSKSQRVVVN